MRARSGLVLAALATVVGCRADGRAQRAGVAVPQPTSEPSAASDAGPPTPRLQLRVVARYPHDPAAYTQGLLWHQGKLYESTGHYGRSTVRRVDLETGRVELERALLPGLFGEGLALVRGRLVQLTWREGQALVWDLTTLSPAGKHRYQGEGWGLATAGDRLVQSDGSALLTFRDPETFAALGTLEVTDRGRPVPLLNELELVGDVLYANVWTTDEIVRIDLRSGHVTGRLDASALRAEAVQQRRDAEVLNGIAWRPEQGTFLLTGKNWPLLFEVKLE